MSGCQPAQSMHHKLLLLLRNPRQMLTITVGISLVLHLIVLSFCAIKKRTLISTPFVVLTTHTQRGPQTYFKTVEQPKQSVGTPTQPRTTAGKSRMPEKKNNAQALKKELKKTSKKPEPAKPAPKELSKKEIAPAPQSVAPKKASTQELEIAQAPVHGKMIDVQTPIQQEVERLWRPPIGSPHDIVCTVRFTVSPRGLIEQAEILSSSKIIAYDMSVMRVAFQFKFDRVLWGKRFSIEFRN